jgi:hypothetical protein
MKKEIDSDPDCETCKELYERLEFDRQQFLNRARQCSELTLPTLIPPAGHTSSTQYRTPWQSIGSRGVNNLASKLLLSLFPPQTPMFRLQIDDGTMVKLGAQPEKRAVIEDALSRIERAALRKTESSGHRTTLFQALKHLLVGGNSLVVMEDDYSIRMFPLDSYVVLRDASGNVLEVVTKETVSIETLDEEIHELLGEEAMDDKPHEIDKSKDEVDVFTRYSLDDNKWRVCQEIKGMMVPGSEGSYPKDKPPFFALRWTPVSGEDYGRSYVEEFLGDLISAEGLSKSIVEGSAGMSRLVWLVAPNGVTHEADFAKAENGDVITGNPNDIHCVQSDKQADLKVAADTLKMITERLAFSFLLNSSVQRQGERVTAEEIRYVAQELEDSLGGVFSVLSQEFQLPYITRLLDIMQSEKELPPLPKDILKPIIVTGIDALGRGHDLNKYKTFMTVLKELGPEVVAKYINMGDLITRIGTATMIDMAGLVKSEQDLAAEMQQAQQMQMQSKIMDMAKAAAPQAVKGMADMANAQMQPPQAAQDSGAPAPGSPPSP